MHSVDDGRFGQTVTDPSRRVPKAHALTVCRAEQAAVCGPGGVCRYVGKTKDGYVCAKGSEFGKFIDQLVAEGKYSRATGDNCDGLCG